MYRMESLDTDFISSVENAVQESLRDSKALLVYATDGDNSWFESWFTPIVSERLKDGCVWLKLVAETREMEYFREIFPDVKTPSVYCIAQGQIIEKITPEQTDMDQFATRLITAVGVEKKKRSRVVTAAERKNEVGSEGHDGDEVLQHKKMVRKAQLTEQEERERIVRLMKADREEAKQRRLSHSVPCSVQAEEEEVKETAFELHDNIKNIDIINSAICTLLIRLTDGKTLKHDFDSKHTLNDVRKWVDTNRTDKDVPYQFHRNIPRETFSESQELLSLIALDLTPRSALILKPLEKSTYRHRIADVEGPGLLGKMYQNVTSWWYKKSEPKNIPTTSSQLTSAHPAPPTSTLHSQADQNSPSRPLSPSAANRGYSDEFNKK